MQSTDQIRNLIVDAVATTLARAERPDFSFELNVGTGGNCHADVVVAADGRSIYLTDGDAQVPFGDDDALHPMWSNVTLCYYDANDDADGYLTIELQHDVEAMIENLIASLQSWIDGDPYRDDEIVQHADPRAEQSTYSDPAVRAAIAQSITPIEIDAEAISDVLDVRSSEIDALRAELTALRASVVEAIRLGLDDNQDGGDCIAGISTLISARPDLADLAENEIEQIASAR